MAVIQITTCTFFLLCIHTRPDLWPVLVCVRPWPSAKKETQTKHFPPEKPETFLTYFRAFIYPGKSWGILGNPPPPPPPPSTTHTLVRSHLCLLWHLHQHWRWFIGNVGSVFTDPESTTETKQINITSTQAPDSFKRNDISDHLLSFKITKHWVIPKKLSVD